MSVDSEHKKPGGPQPGGAPKLTPPDAVTVTEPKPSRLVPMLIVGAGLLLAVLALFVLFLPLGRETQRVETPAATAEVPGVAAKPSPQEGAQPDAEAEQEIEALIGDWLHKQAEAEAENIAAWGGQAYADAVALAEECERLLGKQEHLAAFESCTRAIDELDGLMTAKPALLEQSLLAGKQALDNGDAATAAGRFHEALAIDAGNVQALAGLQRAGNLPQVLRLVKDGTELEAAGDVQGAVLAFRAAVDLDPDYPPAREGRERVEALLADRAFQQAMSKALQELSAGRLSSAAKALQQAAAIRPGDPAVSDLEKQLESRRLVVQLDDLRREADRHEQAERWPEALRACEKALALDARASFAASCKERVSQRIDLDQRIQAFLDKPERLFEDAPLDVARQLIAIASGITPRGPRLAGQIKRLDELIIEAEAEVEVVIKSDGETEISIFHVGRLGRFLEKRLILRTGDYTATGSRNGYRDTRQTLAVRPGSGTLVFTVLCEEPI